MTKEVEEEEEEEDFNDERGDVSEGRGGRRTGTRGGLAAGA
jgi:hypothetical protein